MFNAFTVFTKPLEVLRRVGGEYIDGIWQEGRPISFTINASVQGTKAEVLLTMPEGQRSEETYTLYADTELLLKDIVLLNSNEFLVIKVDSWQHFKATAHYQTVITKNS